MDNSSVGDVLSAIGDQIGYSFSYSNNQINSDSIVSVDFKEITAEDAIRRLIGDRLKRYRINGNQIFLQTQPGGKGTIKGKVKTSDEKPAESVSVQLQGKGIGTVTKDDGTYELKAPAGKYLLVTSFTGLQTQMKNITINENEIVTADFSLAENDEQLQDVLISGTRNKFMEKVSQDVARMPLSNLENAQVYNTVTNALIKERTITNYAELFYNVPGVAPPSVMYSNGNEFFLRGFYAGPEFKDGMVYNAGETEDVQNLEKVDILKGPEGTLYGGAMTTFGGLVNNVSKRPFDQQKGEIGYSTGSWGLSRLTLDYNMPLNKDSTLLFRINGARDWENTFQDYGFKHSYDIAPALTYKVNDKLTLHFNGEFYSQNSTMWQWAYFGPNVTAKNIKDMNMPYNRSFAGGQMLQQWNNSRVLLEANYKISEHWTSSTKYVNNVYYRPESYYMNGNEYLDDSTMSRWIMGTLPQKDYLSEIQQNFTGDFKIGKMRNRLLLGFDITSDQWNSTFVGVYQDTIVMSNPNSDINVSRDKITGSFTRDPTQFHYLSSLYDYSAYASDILNITDRLIASASLRFDRFDNQNSVNGGVKQADGFQQNGWSPKFGLVYQLVKDQISLFSNYQNGFSNNSPQTDGTKITTYKPSQANQWEGGAKFDLFKNKLSATVSYYNISVKDALRSLNSSLVQVQRQISKS